MPVEIHIDGGPSICVQARPPQGTRHEVLFGTLPETEQPVAVKLERIPGTLQRERRALSLLAFDGAPAPRLLAAGTTTIDGRRVACLVTEHCPGRPPSTDQGWRRMGEAFAQLARSVFRNSELPVLDHATFGAEHAQRVQDLGERLAPLARTVPDWVSLTSPQVPQPSPLVLTHGDPGPGNFLDDPHAGTIIDWEEACIAPRGLDLARLAFIALLGSGPAGFQAREHRSRAYSVIAGYLNTLELPWRPTIAEARWWTTVAGIQFIHRRWQQVGKPAPWEHALNVLQTALSQELDWMQQPPPSSRRPD